MHPDFRVWTSLQNQPSGVLSRINLHLRDLRRRAVLDSVDIRSQTTGAVYNDKIMAILINYARKYHSSVHSMNYAL